MIVFALPYPFTCPRPPFNSHGTTKQLPLAPQPDSRSCLLKGEGRRLKAGGSPSIIAAPRLAPP